MRILAWPMLLCTPLLAQGTSWPDYRGPAWNGIAEADVPLEWSEQENVRWKTPIQGQGWSSPVIHDGQVWLTTSTDRGKRLHAVAVSLDTGKLLHEGVVFENAQPEKKNALNSYASPSPTIEDGRVYVHFGTYGTACIDTESFEVLWQRRDINCDHMEGPGSSPILVDDLLVFNVDGGDVQYVIALDKKTGETRWRTPRSIDFSGVPPDLRKAYSTPVLAEVDGKRWLVSSGAKGTAAYDPTTGDELWLFRHTGFSMAPRPLVKDGMLYLSTGFMRAELHAVRLGDDEATWKYKRNVPKMASALLIENRIYMVDDGGYGTCLNAETGEAVWRKRIGGGHCSSPIGIGDRIYFFDREGKTTVIARSDKYRELATNQLRDGFMASPAVVGDAFILRTKSHVYRIEAGQ